MSKPPRVIPHPDTIRVHLQEAEIRRLRLKIKAQKTDMVTVMESVDRHRLVDRIPYVLAKKKARLKGDRVRVICGDSHGSDSETVGKRLKQLGYVTSNPYPLIWTGEILKQIQNVGPGVMGSRWYASMDRPNPATGEVTVTPASGVRGGHAYLCFKWRPAETITVKGKKLKLPERVYFQQSWAGYAPFDVLPEGPQIFWVSMASFKRIVNAGLGSLWTAPKAKPKVKGNPTSYQRRAPSPQSDLALAA